jgi:NADH-quinone oxidoreductase subunit A
MPTTYFEHYLPILIHAGLALIVGGAMLALSSFLGRHKPSKEKAMPYESGVTPVGDTRHPMNVKFYLVAMLFILFDVEAVFLYPWVVVFRDLSHKPYPRMFGYFEMVLYMAFILAGFFYIWKRGALDWSDDK